MHENLHSTSTVLVEETSYGGDGRRPATLLSIKPSLQIRLSRKMPSDDEALPAAFVDCSASFLRRGSSPRRGRRQRRGQDSKTPTFDNQLTSDEHEKSNRVSWNCTTCDASIRTGKRHITKSEELSSVSPVPADLSTLWTRRGPFFGPRPHSPCILCAFRILLTRRFLYRPITPKKQRNGNTAEHSCGPAALAQFPFPPPLAAREIWTHSGNLRSETFNLDPLSNTPPPIGAAEETKRT